MSATHPAVATVAVVLIGVNFGVSWPGFNALIASVVDGEVRQQYFGVNFALVNLGIGVGGIIGGFFVDVTEPSTFTTIFLIDAATSLIPLALLLGPLRHVRTQPDPDPSVTTEGGYREILRRPAVLWMTLLTFFSVFIGYGQIEAGFPAYARQIAQVSTAVVGISFAVNTAVIVLLQFAVLRLITGRRRTRVMQVMALIWAVSWVMLGAAGLLPDSVTAAIAVIAFMGVFAFGETMMQPTIPAIYNDLATDRTRGRYNALNSAAFQGGAILGPLVAGVLLGVGVSGWFIAVMVAGSIAVGVLAAVLERVLPAAANGSSAEVHRTDEVERTPPV